MVDALIFYKNRQVRFYISNINQQYFLFVFQVVYHDGKEAKKCHYSADVFYVALGRWLRFDDVYCLYVLSQTKKYVSQNPSVC